VRIGGLASIVVQSGCIVQPDPLSRSMRRPGIHEQLLDIVYPSECAGCGRPHVSPLCEDCFRQIAHERAREDRCDDLLPQFAFIGLNAAGDYAGTLKDMVLRLKDSESRMALPLAALVAASLGNDPDNMLTRAVCFVPSSRKKIAERGFNTAELLARRVAAILGRPVADALLVAPRMRDQDRTPGAQRWANASGAFHAREGVALGGPVLLVDDVLTTGATADACSRALLAAGASSVRVAVAARAVLRRVTPP